MPQFSFHPPFPPSGLPLSSAWCDDFYLRLNSERLGRTYRHARGRLEAMGARVREAQAALFVWFSIRDFMETDSAEEEMGESFLLFLKSILSMK